VQSFELFCEGVVDRFVFLLIFKVFIDRAFIHPASALFFAACFERRELFTVPASACEYLPVPFAAQHHFLFTFRTSCICRLCHVFTVSAFPILAHKHFAPLAIHFKKWFSAVRTCFTGDIVMFIFFIASFYFCFYFLFIFSTFFSSPHSPSWYIMILRRLPFTSRSGFPQSGHVLPEILSCLYFLLLLFISAVIFFVCSFISSMKTSFSRLPLAISSSF